MAITLAFVALGHVALTDKNFAFFWLLAMQQAFFYHDVCLVWCFHIN
jgi:4-amino-4-deoxy-L-arabinose transferase-like glycosyltransferase